jgi:hypothetical protein
MSNLHGKRVSVHLNLHTGLFSVKCGKQPVLSLAQVHLRNATFRVQPGGHATAVREQERNVHAYVDGIFSDTPTVTTPQRAISYNYNKGAFFYFVTDKQPVWSAPALFLTNKLVYL